MKTPRIVRQAFAPECEHELTMEAVLVLESIGCAYLTGGTPGMKDAVLVWLALTDLPALKAARRQRTVDELVEDWAADKRPAELLALQPHIRAAIEAAFAPAADPDAPADADDPLANVAPKKSPAADGG